MAVLRQFNILGQERLDVPHFRAMESAAAADFDLLMGMMVCGKRSFILNGFKAVTTGAIGAKATALQVATASSKLAHYNASESGTIFFVPADRTTEVLSPTNSRVVGSFTANAVNYVGIDVRRSADDSTADTAMFFDADTHKETPKTVPLGRTLDYVFVISTTDFTSTPTIAAVAKVTTDASNNVTALEDARNLLFRLGSGGSVPDFKNAYPWPEGRLETLTGDVFTGGDRAIPDMKSWMDSMMTRLWEVGGGERWYSSVADRNVKMTKTGSFFSNGEYFEWDGTHLHWKGVRFTFPNSTGYYNDVADQTSNSAGLTDLADGDCIYVDLDFSANRTGGTAIVAAKTSTKLLGSPTIPGGRYIVAWRVGSSIFVRDGAWPVGSHFTPATTASLGVVKLSYAPIDPASPVVLTNTERDRPGPSNGQPGGVAGLWRTSSTQQYDVLGTGLRRGTNQGAGNIWIGKDLLTNGVVVNVQPKNAAVGAGFLVEDVETLSFNGFNATMASFNNQGVSRFSISAIGDVKDFRHATGTSFNTQEQDLASVTDGFETVQHTGTGTGTVAVSGPSGGEHRAYQVKITTAGGLGTGQFSLSYDGGLNWPTAGVTIPGGGVWTDSVSGIVLTFAGTFDLNDIYYFLPRFVPQLVTKDAAGHVRHVIDHNGLPLGRYCDFRENWMNVWTAVTSIPGTSPWAMSADAGMSVSSRHANSTFNAPYVTQDAASTNNADTISLYTTRFFAYIGDAVSFVAEWEAATNNTTGKTVQMGLRDGAGFGNAGIWFEKALNGAWTANATAGGTTSVNTGVTAAGEGNVARFKLEVVGKSIPVGGSAQRTARFFINEVLVAEINSANVGAGPYMFSTVTKANASQVVYTAIGPLQCTWARLLSAPAL